jgi:hypothetical protein
MIALSIISPDDSDQGGHGMRRTRATRRTSWSRIVPALTAVAVTAALLTLVAGPAAAHEERAVERYGFVVGFGDEPAYAGAKNSVQVVITDSSGQPVRDLGDTLEVMVKAGGQEKVLPLEAAFGAGWGTPGDYRAWFIPSEPGRYTFHLHGTVKGQKIDQAFTSGQNTFGDVEDPAKASFPPVKSVDARQLAQRLDRELPRTAVTVQQAVAASQAAERRAREDAAQARLLALGGIALGLIGVVLGGMAMVRRPARPAPPAPRHLDRDRVPVRSLG